MQALPDTGPVPVPQLAPARHAGAEAELLREMLPLDSGVQPVQDPAEHLPIRQRLRPGYRKRRSRCGSNGSRRSHSSSDTIHGDVPTRGRTLNSRAGQGQHRLPTSLC
jgi:hypothetical protein